jgi:DNA (cytosine-5)-methyltransferase 1
MRNPALACDGNRGLVRVSLITQQLAILSSSCTTEEFLGKHHLMYSLSDHNVSVAENIQAAWLCDSRERCDFFHRLRDIGEDSRWRSELIDKVMGDRRLFGPQPSRNKLQHVKSAVDQDITQLREIGRILSLIHGAPNAANNGSALRLDPHAERVLVRVGLYRESGLCPSAMDQKKRRAIIRDLLPPAFRPLLSANLSAHGQKVCRAAHPLCDRCDVRNFCSTYRRAETAKAEQLGAPTVADLFAGAGGMSEGFSRAGFRVILAMDNDPIALRTYRLNHPEVREDRLIQKDIRELKPGTLRRRLSGEQVDVLIGSPPCQGFSHVGFRTQRAQTGYRVTTDERNYLFEYMISAASELQPKLFLMENVPGMHSARHEKISFIEHAARLLEENGCFRTAIWRLNASAFGVPQDRIRYFLVASRLRTLPSRPEEEYQDTWRRDFDVDALPPITFDEAVFDLPPREAGTGCSVDFWDSTGRPLDGRQRRYIAKFGLTQRSPLLYNHAARSHNSRDLELYSTLKPGENSVHALEKYGRDDLMRYRRDIFDDKYARLRGDRPCRTIVSHLAKDGNSYIHPAQTRSITVREAARIQSFHDGYIFCGSVSQQWTQVGNAVPPLLAEAIARNFMYVLKAGYTP